MRASRATAKDVEAAITGALGFLRSVQLPHGEFATLLGSEPTLADGTFDGTPFTTAFALHAFSRVRDRPTVAHMTQRAVRFLESEMGFGGIWRYYSRRQWKHGRIPPDLDDTACASHALLAVGRSVPSNAWVFRCCRNANGVFRTWIVPTHARNARLRITLRIEQIQALVGRPAAPAEQQTNPRYAADVDAVDHEDVDPAVNANVLLYLGETEETRSAVAYLTDFVARGVPSDFSQYYRDPLALFFLISRAYQLKVPSLVAVADVVRCETEALQRHDGSFTTALGTALGAGVLANCAPDLPSTARAIRSLLDQQRADGAWDRHAFYSGPLEFWGSEELTTAIAVDALLSYLGSR